MRNIIDVVSDLGVNEYELYGKNIVKINPKNKPSGKLILVTAINPTPYGEGKTTVSIGLADALNKIEKTSLALREPSMGPVFGRKGGATGSGKTKLFPSEEINLHFTGDIHALTYAANYIAAYIDNHIYRGNKLNFTKVCFKRCLDINDRSLRSIITTNKIDSESEFVITAAHELMIVFCLAKDENDFFNRIGNIVVGYSNNNEKDQITIKDLGDELITNLKRILSSSLKPNLVQTIYGTPAFVHGGPFANIAHGCNSIIATNTALSYSNYVVTEAGFGVDLGAEKFLDIKCRIANIKPSAVVIVITTRALKHHTYENGIKLVTDYCNMLKTVYNVSPIIAINKFSTDTLSELNDLKLRFKNLNIDCEICSSWEDGPDGAKNLAKTVIEKSKQEYELKYAYDMNCSVLDAVNSIINNVYGIQNIEYESKNLESMLKNQSLNDFYICIAKTPFSVSSDPNKLGNVTSDFKIKITHADVLFGAKMIRIHCGNTYLMPGLP